MTLDYVQQSLIQEEMKRKSALELFCKVLWMNSAIQSMCMGCVLYAEYCSVFEYLHSGCVLYDEYCSVWVFTQGMCSL